MPSSDAAVNGSVTSSLMTNGYTDLDNTHTVQNSLATPTYNLRDMFFDSVETSISPMAAWSLDNFAHDPNYLASQEELRCLILSTAQSRAPTREGSPVIYSTDDRKSGSSPQILETGRRIEYLKAYLGQVASWLDMFDSDRAFGIQLPALASFSPALMYAILALSARQIERQEGKQASFDSLQLYQEAIRSSTPLLQSHDQMVIPVCVLLCCMEMMSASALDWRRHLEGCAALFDSFGVNGFSCDLLQAVFWCFARMGKSPDIPIIVVWKLESKKRCSRSRVMYPDKLITCIPDLCGALISDGVESTLLDPTKWLPFGESHSSARSLFRASQSPDMHANQAVYLCAQVCKLISDRTKYLELSQENGCTDPEFASRWQCFWDDLKGWVADRPAVLVPIRTCNSSPFPRILFVHWAAISSNQLYHTACILLLNMQPKSLSLELSPETSALWHAKRICGISLSNPHKGSLNNAIQPLWVAGRLLGHKSEHILIIKLIRSIEASTGWGTCWRLPDLELAWGYPISNSRC